MKEFFDLFGTGRGYNRPSAEPPAIDPETDKAMLILRKGFKGWAVAFVALVLFLVLWSQCVVITYPNQFNAIQRFGEIRYIAYKEGISLKIPFIETVRTLPNMVMLYDIPVTGVITQDMRNMEIDSFILWRVSNPTEYIRRVGGNQVSAEGRISDVSYNSMMNVISLMTQGDVISGRDTLANRIVSNVGNTLEEFGIRLLGIETKRLDLPPENREAVYTRMISERNTIAASYVADGEREAREIRNSTDREVSIMISTAHATAAQTIAEGERQYMEILSEAFNTAERSEFYSFMRALEAAEQGLRGGNTTLILDRDSPMAQVFYGTTSTMGGTAANTAPPPAVTE